MIKTLTCRRTQKEIEHYCQGLLSPEQAAKMESHIRGCSSCLREYEDSQKILALLASQKFPDPGEAVWNRMRSSVMAQISELPARPLPWIVRIWAAPFQWPGYAWATALLLLIMVPVLLYTAYPGKNIVPFTEAMMAELTFEAGPDPLFLRLESLSGQESERLGKRAVAVLAGEVKNSLPVREGDDWSWDSASGLETLNEGELEAMDKKLKTRYPAG
jgi:hypothetical protein